MEELEALIILSSLPHLGSVKIRLLMRYYGSAAAAIRIPLKELGCLPGFGPKTLHAWKQGLEDELWKPNLIRAEHTDTQLIPFTSPHYPKRLLDLVDHPLVLYIQGKWLKTDQRCLAVVGTRQASIYGQEMAQQLSCVLAQQGFTIVSGMARGIDTAAHRGALKAGRTVAILGSGLDHLYPKENSALAGMIRENGALISEFTMQTPPERQNFPQRNRIVSGMTLGTLLIEAPVQSGAMLTVERAIKQGRPVFALPGRVDQESFTGNHLLIKEHRAELIENVQDIIKNLGEETLPLVFKPAVQAAISLENEEQELLQQLPLQEFSVEELVTQFHWPVAKLNGLLMSLVLKKIIKEYPGKIYKREKHG